MVHMLETRCTTETVRATAAEAAVAAETARATAAEAAVVELTQQVGTLTPRRRLTPLRRAANAATCAVLYIINMLLYVVGTVLMVLSSVLAGGGNMALGMRTHSTRVTW